MAAAWAAAGGFAAAHAAQQPQATAAGGSRTLIIYFSQPETDKAENMTREEALSTVVEDGRVYGNNEWFAELIRRQTGADMVRIVPQNAYPREHKVLIAQARNEQDRGFRPEINAQTLAALKNLEAYDRIYLVYPIWWYTFPMILLTLLETVDFSGKLLAPCTAHGGSGLADTEEILTRLQPKAKVVPGFSVHRENMASAKTRLPDWVREVEALGRV